MRLITRSDFDGLACAVLLKEAGIIDDYLFAHPKDIQDGKVQVSENDVLANVPYVPGVGLWFDHHSSEGERLGDVDFKGASYTAPSCARVIWDYYGGLDKFSPTLEEMMVAVDKVDSANLTADEITNPSDWILLGFLMDPRTGLGRFRDYRISNYQLMLNMIELCRTKTAKEIISIPDVQERVDRYNSQNDLFCQMLERSTEMVGNVAVIDLRAEDTIYAGNRFLVYTMFPDSNVSIQIMWGFKKQNIVFTVGHSITNRSCTTDIGKLMLEFGGGGHMAVGTCQVETSKADEAKKDILKRLQINS
ncbi:MAG: exopolyphosphatase [Proteobacteria bacterium]|nr:exopolyphosphatase [Pseudomonadota bacterium]MBU1611410.1 exopolyphosphatase [Pseudomonadota bacterium]